jgi:hypothetical protein
MQRVDGTKVTRLTLGDLYPCRLRLRTARAVRTRVQKSAEAIVAGAHAGEGPNVKRELEDHIVR